MAIIANRSDGVIMTPGSVVATGLPTETKKKKKKKRKKPMDSELDVKFTGEVWVDLPPEITQRMWDVVRAVANGHHQSAFLQVEAVNLKREIDRLLLGLPQIEQTEELPDDLSYEEMYGEK